MMVIYFCALIFWSNGINELFFEDGLKKITDVKNMTWFQFSENEYHVGKPSAASQTMSNQLNFILF